jgi:hypothetical protein
MRISHEIGIRVPVTGQRTATGLFGRILRDLTLSADIFTRLITNLIVGPAVVGGAGKRNVISRLGVKIQASQDQHPVDRLPSEFICALRVTFVPSAQKPNVPKTKD